MLQTVFKLGHASLMVKADKGQRQSFFIFVTSLGLLTLVAYQVSMCLHLGGGDQTFCGMCNQTRLKNLFPHYHPLKINFTVVYAAQARERAHMRARGTRYCIRYTVFRTAELIFAGPVGFLTLAPDEKWSQL